MINIITIKQRIMQLDAGSFQILCDEYLSKKGYPNKVTFGTMSGTTKTTKGTPDTYFCTTNGKYIFAEYTTQTNRLVEKIRSDIEKCLDVNYTGIPLDKLVKIVYCHTSSNISPKDDLELKTLCKQSNVELTLIGIDKLADDLFFKYRTLIKEYLNLPIYSEQIQSYDEFVKWHDSNTIVAPIKTEFLFREKEMETISEAFDSFDVVILSGPAGIGKTRLALEYAKNRTTETNETFYCIHNCSIPLYDDLLTFFEKAGKYFIFIDDANQLSNIENIIEYVNKKADGYNVKILISVRDYAQQIVKDSICDISKYKIIPIKKFTDDQIVSIIKGNHGITNDKYLERIARISEGNCRIAMLAGKVACDKNRLDSIYDVTNLYAEYYGKILKESKINTNNNQLIVLGVLAFLNSIYIDHIESLISILNSTGIDKDIFKECVYELNNLEVLDVYNDYAVLFSDQCLSNYLLKYVFCDKKLISLSEMIYICFKFNPKKTTHSINTILSIFYTDSIYSFVSDEVLSVWNKLKNEDSRNYFEFIKSFYPINPTETLCILKETIDNMDYVNIKPEEIDRKEGKNWKRVHDDILEILGGFADSDNLESALDLYFMYYLKKPNLYIKFYHTAIIYYSIRKNSYDYKYYTQVFFLNKFAEYSDNWKNKHICLLFLDIADVFSKLHFSCSESSRNKKSITLYNIHPTLTDDYSKCREIFWSNLYELSKNSEYKSEILSILNNYGNSIDNLTKSVVEFDSEYIVKIMVDSFSPKNLNACLVAYHLESVFQNAELQKTNLYSFINNDIINIYKLLKESKQSLSIKYEECQIIKKQNIEKFILNSDDKFVAFMSLYNIYQEYLQISEYNTYYITQGINIAIQALSKNRDVYLCLIEVVIKSDNIEYIDCLDIIRNLFKFLQPNDVYNYILKAPISTRNYWEYLYFSELPIEHINQYQLKKLYSFLQDDSDKHIYRSGYRDIAFLEKFLSIDSDVIINASKIILNKKLYSSFIVNIYFSLLFNYHNYSPKDVIGIFSKDISLLEDIYLCVEHERHSTDYHGGYLYEICLKDNSFVNKYIKVLLEEHNYKSSEFKLKCLSFYRFENYLEIIDMFIEEALKNFQISIYDRPEIIKLFILPLENDNKIKEKIEIWISHFIKNNNTDTEKMKYLFTALSEADIKQYPKYLIELINLNNSYELFKELPLTPRCYSYSNSPIPLYSSWIKHFELLLPLFHGIAFIEHRKRVETMIKEYQEMIKFKEIDEILNN